MFPRNCHTLDAHPHFRVIEKNGCVDSVWNGEFTSEVWPFTSIYSRNMMIGSQKLIKTQWRLAGHQRSQPTLRCLAENATSNMYCTVYSWYIYIYTYIYTYIYIYMWSNIIFKGLRLAATGQKRCVNDSLVKARRLPVGATLGQVGARFFMFRAVLGSFSAYRSLEKTVGCR